MKNRINQPTATCDMKAGIGCGAPSYSSTFMVALMMMIVQDKLEELGNIRGFAVHQGNPELVNLPAILINPLLSNHCESLWIHEVDSTDF